MAITQCSECGGKLSTTAPVCPHCGAPPGLALENLPSETKPLPPVMEGPSKPGPSKEEAARDSIPARKPETVATAARALGKAKPVASMGTSRLPPLIKSPKVDLHQAFSPVKATRVSKVLLNVSFIFGAVHLVFSLGRWGLVFGMRYFGMDIYSPWIFDILRFIILLLLPISIVLLAIATRKHMSQIRLGVLIFTGAAMLLSEIAIFIYFKYSGLWEVTLFKIGFWFFLSAYIVASAVALVALGQMHSGRWPMSISILAAFCCLSRVVGVTMSIIGDASRHASEGIMSGPSPWLPSEWMMSVAEFAGPSLHEWMGYFSTANWLFFILALGVPVLLLNWKSRALPQQGEAM